MIYSEIKRWPFFSLTVETASSIEVRFSKAEATARTLKRASTVSVKPEKSTLLNRWHVSSSLKIKYKSINTPKVTGGTLKTHF